MVNSSTIWKVPFPRRFPIIRYLVRVPLSRSYVTHQRVSVGVVLKRFMNYVDRSACGRSPNTLVARSSQSTLLDCWQNVVYRPRIWWMNPRQPKRGGDTLSTLSSGHSRRVVVIQRAFRIIRDWIEYLHTSARRKAIKRTIDAYPYTIELDGWATKKFVFVHDSRILVPNVSSWMCLSKHSITGKIQKDL